VEAWHEELAERIVLGRETAAQSFRRSGLGAGCVEQEFRGLNAARRHRR
jgi:hypothetical protein